MSVSTSTSSEFTELLVERARPLDLGSMSATSIQRAKHCLLDWFGVTIAAAAQPGVEMLRAVALEDGGDAASVVGTRRRGSVATAALINGTAGHYLDYDDVSAFTNSHPTVPVAPAILALAEREDLSGERLIAAFVAGLDVQHRLGLALANDHYERGYHNTATLGTFGAAAACAHLLELDDDQWRHALGIAASQAAGLRANFGTMTKPLHAGKAAQNGVLAAELARHGFTSNPAIVEVDQGFASTMSPSFDPQRAAELAEGAHGVDSVFFKYYSACYGVHSAIEGGRELREQGVRPEDIDAVVVELMPSMLSVCNIQEPTTGLQAKFSIRWCTAVSLIGGNLTEEGFTDAAANDPAFAGLRDRITVGVGRHRVGADWPPTDVTVRLRDGSTRHAAVRMGVPTPDDQLATEWERLVEKCLGLAAPVIGPDRAQEIVSRVAGLENAAGVGELAGLLA